MKVIAIVPARTPSPDLATSTTPRRLHEVDRFAKQVGDVLGIEVEVVECALTATPRDSYLLVFELGRDVPAGMGPRIISVNADRASVMQAVEAHDLAGAVEKHIYWEWRQGDAPRAFGLIGRKDVALRVPARILGGPYTSSRYAAMASDQPGDLVSLLAAYLRAYAQVVTVE